VVTVCPEGSQVLNLEVWSTFFTLCAPQRFPTRGPQRFPTQAPQKILRTNIRFSLKENFLCNFWCMNPCSELPPPFQNNAKRKAWLYSVGGGQGSIFICWRDHREHS
jgi:hypothetical protein